MSEDFLLSHLINIFPIISYCISWNRIIFFYYIHYLCIIVWSYCNKNNICNIILSYYIWSALHQNNCSISVFNFQTTISRENIVEDKKTATTKFLFCSVQSFSVWRLTGTSVDQMSSTHQGFIRW